MATDSNWSVPPVAVKLNRPEIHLWGAYLDTDRAAVQFWKAALAQDELERASRFVFPRDRDRFIAGRGILRAILGRYMCRPPGSIEFVYDPQGKPRLRLSQSDQPIRFNLSHSHGLALYAFSCDREVGIDIEAIRSEGSEEGIAERFFSSKELTEFRLLAADQRTLGFFLCWTRKEAYVKALGAGLTAPLDSFSVSLTPGRPERLLSADSDRWMLRSFEPEVGYSGAVVAQGKDWTSCFWEFNHRA